MTDIDGCHLSPARPPTFPSPTGHTIWPGYPYLGLTLLGLRSRNGLSVPRLSISRLSPQFPFYGPFFLRPIFFFLDYDFSTAVGSWHRFVLGPLEPPFFGSIPACALRLRLPRLPKQSPGAPGEPQLNRLEKEARGTRPTQTRCGRTSSPLYLSPLRCSHSQCIMSGS